MPQFRLTQKFATDCKIKQLLEPAVTTHPLDDWFIDRMIVDRKKIAMTTHAKSTFTFFIPYADAGSAKGMITYFKNHLKELFQQNSLPALALEVEKLFAEEPIFTKTVDRKILGHMNDFRRCAQPYPGDTYPIDWHDIAERINNMPTKGGEQDWLYPVERFNKLLGVNLPKRKYNFSSL
ncbi:MAG: hypothetical protein ABI597_11375 [Gammaproteobacteria bacterium]